MNLFGKILRLPLKLLPKGLTVTILYGELRGIKWVTGSSNHSYWLGWYEKPVRSKLKAFLNQGDVFLDLGAHVGYFTLLGSRLVRKSGKVYAFEPHPKNVAYLKGHLDSNKIDNVVLFEGAISTYEGEFTLSNHSRVGARLQQGGEIVVPVFSLKALLENGRIETPNVIKLDIEGGEYELLNDNIELLRINKPVLLLSTHGLEIHRKCLSLLSENSYSLYPLDSDDIVSCRELLAVVE